MSVRPKHRILLHSTESPDTKYFLRVSRTLVASFDGRQRRLCRRFHLPEQLLQTSSANSCAAQSLPGSCSECGPDSAGLSSGTLGAWLPKWQMHFLLCSWHVTACSWRSFYLRSGSFLDMVIEDMLSRGSLIRVWFVWQHAGHLTHRCSSGSSTAFQYHLRSGSFLDMVIEVRSRGCLIWVEPVWRHACHLTHRCSSGSSTAFQYHLRSGSFLDMGAGDMFSVGKRSPTITWGIGSSSGAFAKALS